MNNVDGNATKYIMDGGFLPLLFVVGRLGFMSIDVVVLVFVIICTRILHIGNIYIVNK